MADRRGIVVPLIILAWIFLTPDPARSPASQLDGRALLEEVIAEEQHSLSVLQNSTWDPDFGRRGHTVNLTGLQDDTQYAWDRLHNVKARVHEQLQYSLGDWGIKALGGGIETPNPTPVYSNVSGYVRGQWKRSQLQANVSIPEVNLTQFAPPGPFGQPGQPRPFGRNITGANGDITVKFTEKGMVDLYEPATNASEVGVELSITDADTYDEHELQLHGVYFSQFGQALLTTTSDKFVGIFALPHFALSEDAFEASKSVVNESISRVIQRQIDRSTESHNPWTTKLEGQDSPFDAPNCELVLYLQQLAPATSASYSTVLLRFLERELRFPTGAVVPSAPDMRFSMVAFSPDCGYILESTGPPDDFAQDGNHLTGPKIEVQYRHSRQHLLAFTFALGLQLFLLMRQMREASTPSTRSRISFYTIALLALGDGFTTMTFLLISLFISGLWINLVGTGFLAFISVSFFGMRFLMDIWHVQAPERERRARAEVEEEREREERFNAALARVRAERDAARAAPNEAATTLANTPASVSGTGNVPPSMTPTTAAPEATPPVLSTAGPTPDVGQRPVAALAPPVTVQRPTDTGATPVFMPSDQEDLTSIAPPNGTAQANNTNAMVQARMPSFASLYTRFYLLLLATLFFSLNATSWPAGARRVFFTVLALCYLSFWIPQIHRNVQRNCRHALNWEFVLGQSVLRLVPFAYFYGYRHNVLFAEVDYVGFAILALWVWIQVVLLVSQELLGPRWFIRKSWAPPAYDYHPVLREDEEGNTLPIGFSPAQASGDERRETKEKGKRVFDCAICMQELEVPVVEAGGAAAGGLLARRMYMVTPCRHVFHSTCLEGWMKFRLQCPICRETLPPL